MEYRSLGKSGLKVSEIALGSWLTYGHSVEQATAVRCIEVAYDHGVNFFDTANVYAQGEAERIVGEALTQYPRDSYVLATKVYFPMGEGPNDRGLSRKHIMEQCHASLQRLGVDYIDLYQCHRYDTETPLDETLRALDDLIAQGKVLYAGVSEWSAVQIADAVHRQRALNLHPFVSNQPRYNLLDRRIEAEVLPVCKRGGIGQVVFSPLAQGVLTGKYKPGEEPPEGSRATDPQGSYFMQRELSDDVLERVERLRPIARDKGLTLPQLALAWVLREPGVSSAIIGASKPGHVEENIQAVETDLSQTDLKRIDEVLSSS